MQDISLDESLMSVSDDDSLYRPTPEKMVREAVKQRNTIVPSKVCFMDLTRLDELMKQLNQIRVCATPGCKGELIPVHVNSAGQDGAITIRYTCNGCVSRTAVLETSSKYKLGNTNEVSIAVQVAFVIAGCTHMTYYKILKHALGIDAVHWYDFQSTMKMLYPVVNLMLDKMCEGAKYDMRCMDKHELGSWSRAVTSTEDDTWHATFSIRNYFNGALYRKHLCQSGRDNIVKEELYQETSKSAEGYAAFLTFRKAKEEGMNIAVQWQDADSSSSNAVTEHFPDAKVMICGGHAGRAHKKQLEKLSKMKQYSPTLIKKYIKSFPSVGSVVCHCSRHSRDVDVLLTSSLRGLETTSLSFCPRASQPKSLQSK